ncbi:ABC-type nitrate/sulfonate/bicarbonate transport system ATPase subunit [Bradyrhizobium sp. F1.13.4]
MLNTIAGLEVPFEGEILVEGAPVYSPRPDVGMVFQQPHLFPWKSVRSNIAHGPRMLGKSTTEAYAIADDLIAMVGLKRFADAYPNTLSGGMQQRVAIARALANQPRVLLMDEPFGALDAQTRAVMQDNLLALRDRIKATIVFVTHDIDEAIVLADRVLIMSAGPGPHPARSRGQAAAPTVEFCHGRASLSFAQEGLSRRHPRRRVAGVQSVGRRLMTRSPRV